MGIAESSHYWVSRLAGNDPTDPYGDFNNAWTLKWGDLEDGSNQGAYWRVVADPLAYEHASGQVWKYTIDDSKNDLTLICAIHIEEVVDEDFPILTLDNGTYRVEVRSNGDFSKLKLVGTSTVLTPELDFAMNEEEAVPILLRLTLDSNGLATLYMSEIIEDDDGNQHYIQVTGYASEEQGAFFGNNKGTVDYYLTYFTDFGAYSPDEMDMSDWVTNSLIQTGLAVVETLKSSRRYYLTNHVTDSSIVYGYDLSSNSFVNRVPSPSVHVLTQKIQSPDFLTLAGKRTDQRYNIILYVTTKGTDYKNAYRTGLSIMGECFDELYTQTGLQSGVDSIVSYQASFDSKMDNDQFICVHTLQLTYMKKVRMFMREV